MYFEVARSSELRNLTRSHAYAVVTLTKPRSRRVTLRPDANRVAVLWRMFDDIAPALDGTRDVRASYCTSNDADAILDFVDALGAGVREIVVACDAGEGRSRGVALALALIYGDATTHVATGRPNTHVVRTILDRFARRTGAAIAMPCIVRYVRRCARHVRREIPAEAIALGACDLCGRRLEPIPIDIATDTVIVRAISVAARVYAAS